MPQSRAVAILALVLLAAPPALAQSQAPPRSQIPGGQDIINRAQSGARPQPSPATPSVERPPSGGSDVADTLAKAGVPASPDAMTGRNEKSADDAAYKVEQSSGLPAQVRDLKDQVPPNPQALIRQLGLHDDPAVRVDFRNRTPSTEEIVDALRPR
jgi:hypothetical protein